MKVIFIFAQMHYAHSNFADAVKADKLKIGPYYKKWRIPFWATKTIIKVPKDYDLYITEDPGFRIIIPFIRLLNRKAKFITLVAYEKPYKVINRKNPKEIKSYRSALEKFDGIVAVSDMVKKLLIELGVEESKIAVARPSPKDEVMKELIQCKPDLKSRNLVVIAGSAKRKISFSTMVDAIKEAREKYSNIKLFVIGNGNESLEKEYKTDFIEFLGFQKNLTDTLKKCSLYVHIAEGDAHPISVQEAMIAGLPVLISEWTGSKELVSEVSKELIVPINSHKVAEKIIWYLNLKDKEKEALSKKSRAVAVALTPEESREEFKTAIKKLTGNDLFEDKVKIT